MQKADKDTIKRNNKQVLLNHLKKRDLSRTDLAEITGLSNSTVSALVSELCENNIVFEKSAAESSGGRKPIILSINRNFAHTLLLKIIPNKIITVLVDLKLKVIYQQITQYAECTQHCISEAVLKSIDKTLDDNKLISQTIVGIGVSIPGLIDHSNNNVLFSALLNLKDFNIKDLILTRLKKNVYIFKDTDAFMLGEYILSDLNSSDSYVYVLVDSGVGLSFMNNGEILQLNRSGLQLGHIQLDEFGPLCNCGNNGCVEAYISEQAAKRDLKDIFSKPEYHSNISADSLAFSDIVNMSNSGNQYCTGVLTRQCSYLGRVIALTVNLFAPNMVLIGGPLSSANINKEMIVQSYFEKSVLNSFRNTEIKFTSTGDRACFIGMADKVFDREFYLMPFIFS